MRDMYKMNSLQPGHNENTAVQPYPTLSGTNAPSIGREHHCYIQKASQEEPHETVGVSPTRPTARLKTM